MFGITADELLLECEIDERRAMRDDPRAGFRRESERMPRAERQAGGDTLNVRGWISSSTRAARTLAWTLLRRTHSDTPA